LLREISSDLADLERLTDDVLAAIRLDFAGGSGSSGLSLQLGPVKLANVVRDSVARFVESYPDRDISLDVQDENLLILADVPILTRLFANLLDNARKYSSGAIRITIAASVPRRVIVVIEDSGVGIDPAELGRVFEPFYRCSRARAERIGGTGLGLTLSRRIVQAHGGELMLESKLGEGTRAKAVFPVAPGAG
jgi:signal transduction histidine kinase